jgi:hypothetical protein
VSGTDPAASEPYTELLSAQARRNIRENLPLEVAFAGGGDGTAFGMSRLSA